MPDPFCAGLANHNILTNLPIDAQVITRVAGSDQPTTAIYHIGSGIVIATTLTLEIAYEYEVNNWGSFNFGLAMYPNILGYMPHSEEVPVSNWALFIGIALILAIALIRFRKMI